MTPEQLYKDAMSAKKDGSGMSLVFTGSRPKGFPRGILLSETGRGKVYRFDPDKVIAWLEKNGLTAAGNEHG